jgi:hypothetical protein
MIIIVVIIIIIITYIPHHAHPAHVNNLNMGTNTPTVVSPPSLSQLVRRQEQQQVVHIGAPGLPKC